MPFAEAADYRFNPFDLTKVWPHGDYQPIQVGRLLLDRNPANFFAEVEQASFSPANLVPGVGRASAGERIDCLLSRLEPRRCFPDQRALVGIGLFDDKQVRVSEETLVVFEA